MTFKALENKKNKKFHLIYKEKQEQKQDQEQEQGIFKD